MKNFRKLIPAFAMLLLSAVLMSTASFAWFSMNTQVGATGMEIKAATAQNLLISTSETTNFGPNVNLQTNVSTLVPCSATATTTDAVKVFAMSGRGTGMTADKFNMGTNATFTDANEGTHYIKKTVYIKSTGAAATNLVCNISNMATSGALESSLRVMLVYTADNGQTYTKKIYAPVANYNYGANAIASVNDGGTPNLAQSPETISSETTVIIGELTADQAYKVDIYVWYEGQDISCYATNAQTVAGASLSLTFTTTAS